MNESDEQKVDKALALVCQVIGQDLRGLKEVIDIPAVVRVLTEAKRLLEEALGDVAPRPSRDALEPKKSEPAPKRKNKKFSDPPKVDLD